MAINSCPKYIVRYNDLKVVHTLLISGKLGINQLMLHWESKTIIILEQLCFGKTTLIFRMEGVQNYKTMGVRVQNKHITRFYWKVES